MPMMREIRAARAAIAEYVDAIELWNEDGDRAALEQLEEATRYLFEDVPRPILRIVLWCVT